MTNDEYTEFGNYIEASFVKKYYKSRLECVKTILKKITGDSPSYADKTLTGFSYKNPIDNYAYDVLYDEEQKRIDPNRLTKDKYIEYIKKLPDEYKEEICENCRKLSKKHNEYKDIDNSNVAERLAQILVKIMYNAAERKYAKVKHPASDVKSDHDNNDKQKSGDNKIVSKEPAACTKDNDDNYDSRNINESITNFNSHNEETVVNNNNTYITDNRTTIKNIHTAETIIKQILPKESQLKEKDKNEIDSILKELYSITETLIVLNIQKGHEHLISEDTEINYDKEIDLYFEKFINTNKKLSVYCKRYPDFSDLNHLFQLWPYIQKDSFSYILHKDDNDERFHEVKKYISLLDSLISEIDEF